MRFITILSLVLLVIIAGCSAVPFGDPTPQEEPAPVMLVNNATLTETFEVAVMDVGSNLTVTREDGDTFNQTIGQGSSTTYATNKNPDVKIEFPESARVHGEYTLEPDERKQVPVENVAPDQAIVVLVYDDPEETYRAIHTVSCSKAILGIRATSMSGGPEDWTTGAHECGY